MQSITLAGITLVIEDTGPPEAPALVFSNSLGTDFRVWDPLLAHLPAGWRRIRYDKRGHGLSDCPPGPWQIADHVADLEGLLAALGVERAVVIGLSVGGLIAQMLAHRHPERVRALVLCDTAARIGTEALWSERMAKIEAGGIPAISADILTRWFTAKTRADATRLAPWRNMLERTTAAGYLETCRALRDCDHRAMTAELRLPCLAVAGEADGSTPPELVRETAALIPGSRFEVIRGAGHIPCVEQPAVLGRLIAEFVESLPN
ncbi:MAG: 3-oxoadipate enol-lactonase [Paracoccaceae bacterium]